MFEDDEDVISIQKGGDTKKIMGFETTIKKHQHLSSKQKGSGEKDANLVSSGTTEGLKTKIPPKGLTTRIRPPTSTLEESKSKSGLSGSSLPEFVLVDEKTEPEEDKPVKPKLKDTPMSEILAAHTVDHTMG